MTATDIDDSTASLMTTAMQMAQDAPDMMAESIAALETDLIPLYELAQAQNDTGAMEAIDRLWAQVQHIHQMATSQAIGTASTGIVATAYKMQRDEALIEVGRVTDAYQQLLTLMGGGR